MIVRGHGNREKSFLKSIAAALATSVHNVHEPHGKRIKSMKKTRRIRNKIDGTTTARMYTIGLSVCVKNARTERRLQKKKRLIDYRGICIARPVR